MKFYQCITDFIFAEDKPERADVLFVPGGPCPEIAVRAARLYRRGMAPYVVPSGKHSILDGEEEADPARKSGTECDSLCDVLLKNGVPEEAIIREEQATYTWENAIFTRRRLDESDIPVGRGIICCQAFHARRCLMYYQEQFPEAELLVCPVVTKGISRDTWQQTEQGIDTVLGEVERCGRQFHQIMRAHMEKAEGKND